MHVLLLTISFPNSYKPQSHIFFKEQAISLAKAGVKTGIISAIPISIAEVFKKRKFDFGYKKTVVENVVVMLYSYPAIPKWQYLNNLVRNYLNKILFRKYILQNGPPKLLHTHVSLCGETAIWIKRKYGIPFILTEHYSTFLQNIIPAWRNRLAKRVIEGSSRNIAVSIRLREMLNQKYDAKFMVIPNQVDTNFFKPLIKKNDNESELVKFITIGNLAEVKNHKMLIEAYYEAFKSNKYRRLKIVGSGPLLPDLKKLVNQLDLNQQIEFYGQANREEILFLLQESDYFVLSSKFETFGVVLIEAMACGLPVLSTKSGGPESILTNEKLGILCENNTESLAKAMVKMPEVKFDEKFIRDYAEEHYSSDKISKQLIHIYESENIRL